MQWVLNYIKKQAKIHRLFSNLKKREFGKNGKQHKNLKKVLPVKDLRKIFQITYTCTKCIFLLFRVFLKFYEK